MIEVGLIIAAACLIGITAVWTAVMLDDWLRRSVKRRK